MPVASVVMPVFNDEKNVEFAIQSILDQSLTDFEFLIYNDGSTDNTTRILDEFKDPRIRIFHSEKNEGYLKWLNQGISESVGKYIFRMDSDDISYPDRLAKQVEYLDAHKQITCCGTQINKFSENEENCISDLSTGHEEIKVEMFFRNPMVHPTIALRKEDLNRFNIRYDLEFYGSEDYDLYFQIINSGLMLANLDEPLLYWRHHEANFTTVYRDRQIINSLKIMDKYFKYIQPESEQYKAVSERLIKKKNYKDIYPLFYKCFKNSKQLNPSSVKKVLLKFIVKLYQEHDSWSPLLMLKANCKAIKLGKGFSIANKHITNFYFKKLLRLN